MPIMFRNAPITFPDRGTDLGAYTICESIEWAPVFAVAPSFDQVSGQLTFTPSSNTTWLIIANCGVIPAGTSGNAYVRLTRTTTGGQAYFPITRIYQGREGHYNELFPCCFVAIDSFGASPSEQTYILEAATSGDKVHVSQAGLLAIPLINSDFFIGKPDTSGTTPVNALARSTTTSTSNVTKATLTFVPDSEGDYLILASATIDNEAASLVSATLWVDSVSKGTGSIKPVGGSQCGWQNFVLQHLTYQPHTIEIGYQSSQGETVGISNASIVVLDISAFNQFAAICGSPSTVKYADNNGETDMVQVENLDAYLAQNGYCICLTSSCVSNTVENNKSWIQYQGSYNTSSWPVENQMYAEYKYPAFYDEYPIADLYVADVVAGASNWKILLKGDLDQPYGSNSASIRNSNIFLIGTALTGGSATVPSVTTDYVTLVGSDLSLQGSITSAGGAIVSARGFVYDTTSVGTNPGNVAPALSGYLHSVYDSGFLGIGTFFKSVEDVTEGFTYFVRAYAQNSVGFSYGEEVSLLIPSLPAVTTDSVLTVGQATGSLINTGFVPVTTEGFVYSTSSVSSNPGNVSPVSSGYTDYVFSTGSFSEGTFSQKLLRILPNTRYYVRAYVQNSKGYAYGDEITVLTDVLLWKQGAFYCAESDQTTSLEFSDNVLNGDLLLVNVTWYDSENTDGGPVPVITDTLGNIFTLVQSYYDENFGQGWATYYTINANGTSADTILAAYSSPSVSYTALLIDEFQGLFESTPLDDSASHYDVYESGNPSTRDLVVSTTCDLIYSLYGPTDPPSLPSAGDNFIVDGVYSNVWGNPEAYVGTEHRLVYSTGNVPVAWNIATTPAGSIVIGVAFKVADSGPPETSSDSLFGWI